MSTMRPKEIETPTIATSVVVNGDEEIDAADKRTDEDAEDGLTQTPLPVQPASSRFGLQNKVDP